LSENELAATATASVGPVKAKFKGKITLSNIDRPNGYRVSGEGSSGAAGFAKGGATVTLRPDGDGTLLHYDVEATVGGKLAQIGSRLVDAAARKMAEDFFLQFNELVSVVPVAKTAADAEPPHVHALRPSVWVPLLIAIVGFLLYMFARD
jgi:carbon monoxide dehydrogenase subunit G